LVAINESQTVIRLGACKRAAEDLVRDLPIFAGHVERFLDHFPHYRRWRVERACLAPLVPQNARQTIEGQGYLVQDLSDLTTGL
jgi:hypothetical protein